MTDIYANRTSAQHIKNNNNQTVNPVVQKIPSTSRLRSNAYQSDTQEVEENGIYVIPDQSLEDMSDNVMVVSKRSLDDNEVDKIVAEDTVQDNLNDGNLNVTEFDHCLTVPELGRYVPSGRAFHVQYSLRIGSIPFPDRIMVRAASPIIMKFVIKQNIDIGGTLRFDMAILKESLVSY